VEDELRNLKAAYAALKDNMKGDVLQSSSIENELCLACNKMDTLKQWILE
jgi:hypothetical protein